MTLAGLALALSCGGGGSPRSRELQVMSFAPKGVIDKAETIVIRFDEPVVDEAKVSKAADQALVKVSPAFAWNGFWQDQRTLVIDPSDKLTPSTKYTVALQGELARRTKNFELSFVHRPIAVEGVAGIDAEMISPDGDLPIAFNVPVTAIEVAAHCKLARSGGKDDIALVGIPGAAAQNVKVKPAQPLQRGGAYTLTCEKLTGAGGNLPLAEIYTLPLGVRPELEITGATPDTNDVAADEVQLSLTFSTPVTLDAIRKAIKSTPAIPGLDQGYLGDEGRAYHVTTDLDTQTRYNISVVGLVDTFGQTLATEKTFEFKTGDARPRISMERGIFALEATAKGYPVWTRSIGKYEVECAQIPKERLVQVLTTDMNYDAWGGNTDVKPIDWKAIKIKPKTTGFKPSTKNKWALDELELGKTCASTPGQRGVFLAEVRSDEIEPDANRGWLNPRKNRVLANVTDLGVLIKTGTSSGVVWVTSLATGAPIGGATVTVYTPQGKQVHAGVTTADGLVKIPGTSVLKKQDAQADEDEIEDWDSYRSQRLIAVVENGKDLAVVDGNWANGIQLWNFGVTEDRRGGATKIRGFIQSDRGLYRPGESVHFKGLAREIKQGRAPAVPSRGKPVEIEVQDSRGQTVLNTEAKLSAFGGFAFDLTLGEEATVGDYYVRAKVADQVFREKFSVEEFRAATFELKLGSANANPQPGEKLRFDLDAKYLMGSPTAEAAVEWGLRKRAHRIRFKGYDAFTFSANPREWYWDEPEDDYGEFIGDGTGKTNAQGHLVIEARDTAKAFTGPVDYILSTNVTDGADQTMGKSAIVTAHKTQFYLGIHANELVQAVGMPFGVNLVALEPDGKRRATKAKLSMTRTVHSCAWEQLGSRSFQRCESSPKKMFEREIQIANAGTHTERIYPTEPGDYVIELKAKDALGNEVTAASQIWVIGKGEAFWSGDEGARMTVVAGKPTYDVGDTAKLVAQANLVKPTALITVERDGVIDAQVKKLSSASEGIELKIQDTWAPNVYAGITLVQGRQGAGDEHRPQFKMGLVELKVASTHKELQVGVELDAATVRPGDKVSGKIRVTKGGQPVRAEVSLSAADEGVLQLISYATPNPMKTFYASYGLGVDAATNWNRVARIADPTKGDPDEGGDGGSTLGAQRVRSKFVSSAYWNAMLVTNEKGEIPFDFIAPDNLTAFRLMAVAADGRDQFGAGENRLTINKPVMAAPALPRFLRSGDAASVGIVVHNNTDIAGKAVVTAKADGATLESTTQTIDLAANSSQRVRFTAKASENAAATFEFSVVVGGDKRDAVRVTVPIDRPRIFDNRLIVEQALGKTGTWSGPLGVATDVLRDESTVAITIDRTGVGDLIPGLRSLVEYPYGCLEQTMSRFVPLVAAKDLANTLDDASLKGTKANAFIKAGTAKVIRHQQGDGHWSLWPQSQTYPHLTAYAMWGLTIAQQSGENIPGEVFDNGIRALLQWANKTGVKPDGEGAVMAMGAYVMAMRGKPDASLNARLYAVRSGLPKWGQAFLLRALSKAKADPAQIADLENLVEAGITVDGGKASVREAGKDPSYHFHYMHSDIRASAMTLAALLEVDPQNKYLDKLAAGLKAARSKSGDWVSTQETLWSLVALTNYGRARSRDGVTVATIKLGGKVLSSKQLKGAEIAKLDLSLGKLTSDQLEVSVDGGANISVRVREARVDALKPIENGFKLARSYLDAKGNAARSFKAGDMVTVKLELTAMTAQQWVALVDPIPAGFEVVNPKLAAGGVAKDQPTTTDPWARRWGAVTWDHQELRDDRVQWFADKLSAGSYQMTYQARATIDGTFSAMPATVEAMYQPDVRARTAREIVSVTR